MNNSATYPFSDFSKIRNISNKAGGFFTEMTNHCASFEPGNKTLIVSFDSIRGYRRGGDRWPWARKMMQGTDWAHLGIMSKLEEAFRHPDLLDFFDKLKADGFFDQFDQVVFCGYSIGSFGALAFSSVAPEATVLCFGPRFSKEDAKVTRYLRFEDGSGRYDIMDNEYKSAKKVFVIYDPTTPKEKLNAQLVQGDNIVYLECRGVGHNVVRYLNSMDVTKVLLKKAVNENLNRKSFYKLYRGRFESADYLYYLFKSAVMRGHNQFAIYLLGRLKAMVGNAWMDELVALHKHGIGVAKSEGKVYQPFKELSK